MPVGIRGLIIAGVFATMMGSTSAALNALATAFIRDFYQPYLNRSATDAQSVRAARVATAVFGALMILVATGAAYTVLKTDITIIPLALGVLGYGYGSLLGVFLLGVLTKRCGTDLGNVFGMLVGVAAVLILAKVEIPYHTDPVTKEVSKIAFGGFMPSWWPAIAWPYYVFIGCTATFVFSLICTSPDAFDEET
jgi:SSS family solute:Na+ symporter